MFALKRTISPYTGPDLFLGLFDSVEAARAAGDAYIAQVRDNDPWAQQAYRDVDLDTDVVVEAVDDRRVAGDGAEFAYLVTAHIEQMGWVVRRILAVFSSRSSAQELATKTEEGPEDSAPNWCDVDEVRINRSTGF